MVIDACVKCQLNMDVHVLDLFANIKLSILQSKHKLYSFPKICIGFIIGPDNHKFGWWCVVFPEYPESWVRYSVTFQHLTTNTVECCYI